MSVIVKATGGAGAAAGPPAGYLNANMTGATDAGPAIQAAYDAGATAVTLAPGGIYLINTPVFLDTTNPRRKFVINGNGATLRLGSGLPTVSDWAYDTTTKWAFHVNTLRTGLSGGVVNAAANKATPGGGQTTPALTLRDVFVDGQDTNVGVAFGNRATSLHESVTLYRARVLLSWIDYPDGHKLHNCNNRSGFGTDSWLVIQTSNGDGLSIDSCTTDSSAGIANLDGCHGGTIRSTVGGALKITRSRGILISGLHTEANQTARTYAPIQISNSTVTFDTCELWRDPANRWGAIVIDDAAGEDHSDVTIRDTDARLVWYDDTPDGTCGPLLHIAAANPSTRVTAERCTGTVSIISSTPYWRTGFAVTSTDSAITTALSAGAAQIATGSFELRRRGTTAWGVTASAHRSLRSVRQQTAPAIGAVDVNVTRPIGTLTSGALYEYAVAALDEAGDYSQVSAAVSQTAGASGSLLVRGNTMTRSAPTRLVLWRRTGTGVLATPDRYVVLPHDGMTTRLYDTGGNVNGVPWITTSVPVPNTVAAADTTREGVLISGGLLYVEAGALKYRGTSGTVTTLGLA